MKNSWWLCWEKFSHQQASGFLNCLLKFTKPDNEGGPGSVRIRQPCTHEPTCKDPSFHQRTTELCMQWRLHVSTSHSLLCARGTVTHRLSHLLLQGWVSPFQFLIAGRPAWGFQGSISRLSYTTKPTLLQHGNSAVTDHQLCTHTETGSRVPGKAAASHTLPGRSRGRIYISILKLARN